MEVNVHCGHWGNFMRRASAILVNVYHGHWGDFMRWASAIFLIPVVCSPWLRAAQFSGSVRAADQLVPGATVTARQGETKVTAFTDENGRYSMDLAPGIWDIQVDMFEFTPAKGQVEVGAAALTRNWVLNMPKVVARGGPAAATSAAPIMPLPGATGGPRARRRQGRAGRLRGTRRAKGSGRCRRTGRAGCRHGARRRRRGRYFHGYGRTRLFGYFRPSRSSQRSWNPAATGLSDRRRPPNRTRPAGSRGRGLIRGEPAADPRRRFGRRRGVPGQRQRERRAGTIERR